MIEFRGLLERQSNFSEFCACFGVFVYCLSLRCRLDESNYLTWVNISVPLTVEPGKPVAEPMYQETPKPLFSEVEIFFHIYQTIARFCMSRSNVISPMRYQAMESCPKANVPNFKELLKEENFYLKTEVSKYFLTWTFHFSNVSYGTAFWGLC